MCHLDVTESQELNHDFCQVQFLAFYFPPHSVTSPLVFSSSLCLLGLVRNKEKAVESSPVGFIWNMAAFSE